MLQIFKLIVPKGNSINNKITHNVDNVKYAKLKWNNNVQYKFITGETVYQATDSDESEYSHASK